MIEDEKERGRKLLGRIRDGMEVVDPDGTRVGTEQGDEDPDQERARGGKPGPIVPPRTRDQAPDQPHDRQPVSEQPPPRVLPERRALDRLVRHRRSGRA